MLLRRSTRLIKPHIGLYSTIVEPKLNLEEFRTKENDPVNHSKQHIGKFYKIDDGLKKKLFGQGGLPKKYEKQIKTFNEACLMVRPQAVEVMDYINRTDFSKPVVRYLLYGERGAGKTMTMAHLVHYGHQNGFCLVHVPYAPDWYKRPKEFGPSATHEGMVDLPLDAAAWLIHFKLQNNDLFTKNDVRISKTYDWSKREQTAAGSKFIELVDHGINRAKYASDVIAALMDEIKIASTAGKIKTMVLIDGYNSFFYEQTRVFSDTRKKHPVTPDKVTLTQPFINITNYDWCNGVCVLTADIIGMLGWERESYLPRYLLGKEGFEHLDPFVPIKVDKYDERQFDSCISYYVNRKWIQNTSEGFDKELKFLSNSNPYKLMELCNSI
ncbi:small ribosomal subunit protein mS29 [Chironomus tepperi]|uniref:small ribosomal subunit protein mS29 n=1 Tax=Chironomus tepperi TaxID=113505 RepID=UPI00391F3540